MKFKLEDFEPEVAHLVKQALDNPKRFAQFRFEPLTIEVISDSPMRYDFPNGGWRNVAPKRKTWDRCWLDLHALHQGDIAVFLGWSHSDSDKTIRPLFPIYIAKEFELASDVSFRFNALAKSKNSVQHGFLKHFVDYTPTKPSANDFFEF